MGAHARSRPRALYGLLAALVLQGLSGLAGGFGLVLDPTGESLRIPREWLEGSPFPDYLVPGLVLLTLLGLGPLGAAYGVWTRRAWAWSASLLVGLALLAWIAVEIAVVGYQPEPPLQLVYGVLGVLIAAGSLLPSVREHLGRSPR